MKVIKEFFGGVNTPVAIATDADGKPSVRFFSFKMYEDDKIYFMTAKSKNVYKELCKNPKMQICSLPNDKNEWVRIDAEAKFEDNKELIQKAFDIFPFFTQVYKTPDNEDIALFFLDKMVAKKQNIMGKSEDL